MTVTRSRLTKKAATITESLRACVELDQIIAAYDRTGNVWEAGKAVGLSGQTVHRRLKAAGIKMGNPVTDADRQAIRSYYETTPREDFDLKALSLSLGRTKPFVCRLAGEMGLTQKHAPMSKNAIKARRIGSIGKWSRHPHPRGALGMHHTEENKAKFSAVSKKMWGHFKATGTGLMSEEYLQKVSDRMSIRMNAAKPENMYSRGSAGYRDDLGPIYFRSSWEANYARYLNWLLARGEIDEWHYEPDTFWFEKIKRGVRSYKPDFRIHEKQKIYYVEIKGYMDAKSKTKLKRMRIYYPATDLRLVAVKEYRAIASTMRPMLAGWEGK